MDGRSKQEKYRCSQCFHQFMYCLEISPSNKFHPLINMRMPTNKREQACVQTLTSIFTVCRCRFECQYFDRSMNKSSATKRKLKQNKWQSQNLIPSCISTKTITSNRSGTIRTKRRGRARRRKGRPSTAIMFWLSFPCSLWKWLGKTKCVDNRHKHVCCTWFLHFRLDAAPEEKKSLNFNRITPPEAKSFVIRSFFS